MDEVLRSNELHDIDVVFYDLAQAFDSLWVEHTLLDLFENEVDSNAINLLHELSKNNKISIKTPTSC